MYCGFLLEFGIVCHFGNERSSLFGSNGFGGIQPSSYFVVYVLLHLVLANKSIIFWWQSIFAFDSLSCGIDLINILCFYASNIVFPSLCDSVLLSSPSVLTFLTFHPSVRLWNPIWVTLQPPTLTVRLISTIVWLFLLHNTSVWTVYRTYSSDLAPYELSKTLYGLFPFILVRFSSCTDTQRYGHHLVQYR